MHLTIVNRGKKWCERYLQFTKNCEFCTSLIVWHLQQYKLGWAVELPRWSTVNIKIKKKNKSSKCDHASSFSKTSILTIVSNTFSTVKDCIKRSSKIWQPTFRGIMVDFLKYIERFKLKGNFSTRQIRLWLMKNDFQCAIFARKKIHVHVNDFC